MAAKLLYRDAQGRDAAVDLPPDGAFLGRAVDCVVRTDDAMVSRKNCKFALLGGRWYAEDQGSANGTFVNERRIQKEVINHGDVIRCGSLQVRFIESPDAAPFTASKAVPAQSEKPGPMSDSVAQTGHHPIAQIEALLEGGGVPPDRVTSGQPSAGTSSTDKRKEEAQKGLAEVEALKAAAAEAKQQRDETAQKIEAADSDNKRLRIDLAAQKDAFEKAKRQSKQVEEEHLAQQRVNDQFRGEVKQLKGDLEKVKTTAEELRVQNETKDRQLSSLNDDVRRAKQTADSLNAKLVEVTRARDEQIRAINDQHGDAERLREVLKEREKMLEERRVGLVNLDVQLKETRTRADALEKDLFQAKGERDRLKDRLGKNQAQLETFQAEIDRLNNAVVAGQDAGGEQLSHLGQQNTDLRAEVHRLQGEVETAQQYIERTKGDIAQMEKLRATATEYAEYKGGEKQRIQQFVDQATRQTAEQVKSQLETAFQAERQKLAEARTAALRERDEALSAAHASAAATQESQVAGQAAVAQAANDAAREKLARIEAEVQTLVVDRDGLRARLAESEEMLQQNEGKLHESEEKLREAAAKLLSTPAAVPAPAAIPASTGDADGERLVQEIKSLAATAYDGINDALSELRTSIMMAQNTYEKLERTIPDKAGARAVADAIEQTMDRADEAKGHIRSLRSILD